MCDQGPKRQEGFSLIEILVALLLMTLVMFFTISNPFSYHNDLSKALEGIERGVRFSVDEAALRNSMVRIHFFLDNEEQEYAIEYGPNDNFILPLSPFKYSGVLSEKDEEARKLENDDLNKNFNKVQEFKDENETLPSWVKVVGVGTPLYEELISDFEASLYIYPTGEKDNAIIIMGTDEELATLTIDAFTMDIDIKYYPLNFEGDEEDLPEAQLDMAQEIFKSWLKDK
jgi:prepilin-type N-terminal cleavage/methylation domain-containing protein